MVQRLRLLHRVDPRNSEPSPHKRQCPHRWLCVQNAFTVYEKSRADFRGGIAVRATARSIPRVSSTGLSVQ
ncbi:hypothetical protein MPTK1_5g03450 [Marchantia polymorpha subsp. ruderalis]|uniref:Uncharacterized protein n=2 Tax=Marchantia polymorpha TaxID=3197 RepID=A0AAF6BEI8_MARPO|nr:hypothetical protein MARPO_0133s0042 [Marchantia polymorpha]BBN10422.1 hypothetical protein Mp_5g03450 [Marchantia polymorpha subsp. ruderalis]|eukprot:PTQ29901.1 hypothetical protein MARPO_0133s0042 [Marchantia polymorpha]